MSVVEIGASRGAAYTRLSRPDSDPKRSYASDNFIDVYFPTQTWTPTGSLAVLRKATYLGMLGQALEMAADISVRRSQNAWGCITWQLNEIWPTGGWGSLEYGTVGFTAGQVRRRRRCSRCV